MKIKSAFFLLFLITSGFAHAKTVYVTDNLTFHVKTDDDHNSPVLTTVTSGTALSLLSNLKRSSEFAKVQLADGQVGYILKAYLMPQPSGRWYLERTTQELAKLKQENAQVQAELMAIKKGGANAITEALTRERDKLAKELNELKITAATAVEVKKQRDSLQEDFIKANRELEQLRLEKQTLETNANQDWFMYGGLLALFGVVLGYVLPKLSWRRKQHGWDSF